jgi:hypothetical protein
MMKTKLQIGAGMVLCAGLLTVLHAADNSPNARADAPKPEQIIEKAIQAHGGADRLEGLSGFVYRTRRVYPEGTIMSEQITVQASARASR